MKDSTTHLHAYMHIVNAEFFGRPGHFKLYLSMNFRWEIVAFLCSFAFFFDILSHFFSGESLNFLCVPFLLFSGFYRRCLSFFCSDYWFVSTYIFQKEHSLFAHWCNGEQIFSLVISCWMAIFTFSIHRLFISVKSFKCTLYSSIQYRTLNGLCST